MGHPGGRSLRQLVVLNLPTENREHWMLLFTQLLFVDSRTPGKRDGFASPLKLSRYTCRGQWTAWWRRLVLSYYADPGLNSGCQVWLSLYLFSHLSVPVNVTYQSLLIKIFHNSYYDFHNLISKFSKMKL